MTASERAERTRRADELCARAWAGCGGPETGIALIAVGGYGRGELAPYSDLDVVLVHDDEVEPGRLAEELWYPLWDSGTKVDHAVRSVSQMATAAGEDLRVILGLLEMRHLAGDTNLTLRLRARMLADWRRSVRERLPELRRMVEHRHARAGELAHLSVPDVKDAAGGLRDAVVLRALVATWLVDVPHSDLERSRQVLLDFRDLLHEHAGRGTDRVAPEMWGGLAQRIGLPDALAAQTHLRRAGRRTAHIGRLAWQRVDTLLTRSASGPRTRRPSLEPVAPGVAVHAGELVLDSGADPQADPLLLLRAAAEAAERGLVLAPATAARLVRTGAPLPDPWPAQARDLLVRLLAAGSGLLPVWETLEETGAIDQFLPEWERIRLLPHASPIHRFTVDRHVVETCIEASALIRRVARPDILLVAALLHDIGKGGRGEHSAAGEPISRAVATRMGFAAEEVDLIATLVRWHLVLAEVATTRDPEDPATVESVAGRVSSPQAVELLLALTEADARATAEKLWSGWRAGLVRELADRTMVALADRDGPSGSVGRGWPGKAEVEIPTEVRLDPGDVHVQVQTTVEGSRVRVVSGDRLGLLADAAAMFALQRISVRAARAWTQETYGVSVWEVAERHLDPAALRHRLLGIIDGRVDARGRLSRVSATRLEPTVVVRPDASATATVVEVRMEDRPGVVHLVCAALADHQMSVRSAHVSTLGPQAVDVFYVQEDGAGALSDERAALAAHAVRAALLGVVELAG